MHRQDGEGTVAACDKPVERLPPSSHDFGLFFDDKEDDMEEIAAAVRKIQQHAAELF